MTFIEYMHDLGPLMNEDLMDIHNHWNKRLLSPAVLPFFVWPFMFSDIVIYVLGSFYILLWNLQALDLKACDMSIEYDIICDYKSCWVYRI